ncbi:MAG TPA: SRPBCC family protein [Acidimicrobiales bacterium]|nr:SRPBCC family protein [Acidimicrobiales bacterium]
MARRYEFEGSARSTASAQMIWPLVGDVSRWKEWTLMTRSYLLREGDPAPDGMGALRRFAVGPGGSTEEVVVWDPPHHLGYVAVKGLPVRHYRADVHLDEDGTGTVVTWRCSVEPLIPGTGAMLRLGLRTMVRSFARGLCRYADQLDLKDA